MVLMYLFSVFMPHTIFYSKYSVIVHVFKILCGVGDIKLYVYKDLFILFLFVSSYT